MSLILPLPAAARLLRRKELSQVDGPLGAAVHVYAQRPEAQAPDALRDGRHHAQHLLARVELEHADADAASLSVFHPDNETVQKREIEFGWQRGHENRW